MAIALTDAQVRSLRARFDAHGATPQAHASTWSRRLYAPFFIDAPEMADVKRAILRAHPRHVVAFDIVFESRGNETAWHTNLDASFHSTRGPERDKLQTAPFEAALRIAPRSISGRPKSASSDAITTSHDPAIAMPPPRTNPWQAAIVGTWQS